MRMLEKNAERHPGGLADACRTKMTKTQLLVPEVEVMMRILDEKARGEVEQWGEPGDGRKPSDGNRSQMAEEKDLEGKIKEPVSFEDLKDELRRHTTIEEAENGGKEPIGEKEGTDTLEQQEKEADSGENAKEAER